MKKAYLISIIICMIALHHYYHRTVDYKIVYSIKKPAGMPDFHDSDGFYYVRDIDTFVYLLSEYWTAKGYEGVGSEELTMGTDKMDFENNDYLIVFQKHLQKLKHSPHLRHTMDLLEEDKRIPLVPSFADDFSDSIHVYQIKKNDKYRTVGP